MRRSWLYSRLSNTDRVYVNRVCDQYESIWKQGKRPDLEATIGKATGLVRQVLLYELLGIELDYRWKEKGKRPSNDRIAALFPGIQAEVSSMLEKMSASERPFESTQDLSGLRHSASVSSQDERVRIGRFELLEILGKGSQAVVYQALDVKLNNFVAIKVSRRRSSQDDQYRICKEARILDGLKHPNIAQFRDVGVYQNRAYIAMEYVGPKNLWYYADRPGFTEREAAVLLEKVARGISAAHQIGIFHRDISPKNIVMTDDGEPKIVDLGLAAVIDVWANPTGKVGDWGGTPEFMAPELACQINTGEMHADKAVDIFSLGAVLYWMLTKKVPFGGANSCESLEKARECRFDAKLLLNEQEVSKSLAAICLSAMEKDPAKRIQSAEQLANELREWIQLNDLKKKPSQVIDRIHDSDDTSLDSTKKKASLFLKPRTAAPTDSLIVAVFLILFIASKWLGGNDRPEVTFGIEGASPQGESADSISRHSESFSAKKGEVTKSSFPGQSSSGSHQKNNERSSGGNLPDRRVKSGMGEFVFGEDFDHSRYSAAGSTLLIRPHFDYDRLSDIAIFVGSIGVPKCVLEDGLIEVSVPKGISQKRVWVEIHHNKRPLRSCTEPVELIK